MTRNNLYGRRIFNGPIFKPAVKLTEIQQKMLKRWRPMPRAKIQHAIKKPERFIERLLTMYSGTSLPTSGNDAYFYLTFVHMLFHLGLLGRIKIYFDEKEDYSYARNAYYGPMIKLLRSHPDKSNTPKEAPYIKVWHSKRHVGVTMRRDSKEPVYHVGQPDDYDNDEHTDIGWMPEWHEGNCTRQALLAMIVFTRAVLTNDATWADKDKKPTFKDKGTDWTIINDDKVGAYLNSEYTRINNSSLRDSFVDRCV